MLFRFQYQVAFIVIRGQLKWQKNLALQICHPVHWAQITSHQSNMAHVTKCFHCLIEYITKAKLQGTKLLHYTNGSLKKEPYENCLSEKVSFGTNQVKTN